MTDELKRIWREAAMAYSRYYLGICLVGQRKISVRMALVLFEISTKHIVYPTGMCFYMYKLYAIYS